MAFLVIDVASAKATAPGLLSILSLCSSPHRGGFNPPKKVKPSSSFLFIISSGSFSLITSITFLTTISMWALTSVTSCWYVAKMRR